MVSLDKPNALSATPRSLLRSMVPIRILVRCPRSRLANPSCDSEHKGVPTYVSPMINERTEVLTAPDGATSDGWLFLPGRGSGPGILLLQEIFGVGPFVRSKAADLAG